MQEQGTRTSFCLRRMKRKSLSAMPWALFNPTKARPEEVSFDLLDAHQRPTDKIVWTKFKMRGPLTELTVRTPWGEGNIRFTREGTRVYVNGREIALFRSYMLRGKAELAFPDGTILHFDKVKGSRNDIVCIGADGKVGVFEEEGAIPERARTNPMGLTREEIKALPKEDRPRSIETGDYVLYRIEAEGKVPANQKDLVCALCILASFGRLVDEIP